MLRKHQCLASVVLLFSVAVNAHADGGRGFNPTQATFAPTMSATLGATSSSVVGPTSATAPSSYQGSYKGGNYYSFGAPSYANSAACPMGQFPVIGGTYGWEQCMALYRASWIVENVSRAAAIRYLCSVAMMEEMECRAAGYTAAPRLACSPFNQSPC